MSRSSSSDQEHPGQNGADQSSAGKVSPNGLRSGFDGQSLAYVERLYSRWLDDPPSVSDDWRHYFEELHHNDRKNSAVHGDRTFPRRSVFNPPTADGRGAGPSRKLDVAGSQELVDQLIRNYRVRGHIYAQVNPLGERHLRPPEMDPAFYGFTEADMDRTFSTSWSGGATQERTLREILRWLENTYCRSIGVQFMHIDSLQVRLWLQERMEATENRIDLSREEQLRIFTRLRDAVVFEEFIQKKYVGAKSFSLEGAESLIPLLELAIERAARDGIREIVLGMAHRGRLNVLANIMGKSARQIFREFEDVDPELQRGRGDVKYHMGYSSDWTDDETGSNVHLSLCFNPSHLEFVNGVALGRVRAKQDRHGDSERCKGMALLIHGDAAFAGEGVVQETLNMSELPGYATGGTMHVIVNNQLGFTTSPEDDRSSTYATDVAKMLQIPVFHVNGEDPEAVAQVVNLAMEFRKRFKRDVVIDMYCFRRRGHNEGDEPSFTQPRMYKLIDKRDSVGEVYLDHLLSLGEITRDEAEKIVENRRRHLEEELAVARSDDYVPRSSVLEGIWEGYAGGREDTAHEVDTGVPTDRSTELLTALTELPEDFTPHPKIKRLLKMRRDMATGERPLDWGTAELLALGSLAVEGYPVRMTGQDTERGTFSQRHSVLHDYETGQSYMPIRHLTDDQAEVEIRNSPLSEAGVVAFDYGYSLDRPDGLTLWEAQFGDFANAAQVIIDQFIVSAEDKWNRLSGIVLLLPHGFEGQGPEHSSARLERFLMLAAEHNIQIVNPTTPAQHFHCLRRQVLRKWRKPLIVMTPKSLLRLPAATSTLEECAESSFHRVIPDHTVEPGRVRRVLLCSGKIYYELDEQRKEREADDIAICRLEQIYPIPFEELREALEPYDADTEVVWVQEEPENMGAWRFLYCKFSGRIFDRWSFNYVARPASASPATGSKRSHELEQSSLFDVAFGNESLIPGHV